MVKKKRTFKRLRKQIKKPGFNINTHLLLVIVVIIFLFVVLLLPKIFHINLLGKVVGDERQTLGVSLSECKTSGWSSGETYILTQNLVNDSTCMDIDADNVILNCNGYSITGNQTDSNDGVYLNGRINITIKNCEIYNFSSGIYLYYTNSSFIVNNTANINLYDGFWLDHSYYNNLTSNTANNNSDDGFSLYESRNNLLVSNIAKYNTNYNGFYLTIAYNNTLISNTADYNSYGIYLSGSINNTLISNTANYNSENGLETILSTNNTFTSNFVCYNNQSGGDYYDINDLDENNWTDTTCDTNNGTTTSCDTSCPVFSFSIISPINNSWYNALRFNLTSSSNTDSCWFSFNHEANKGMTKLSGTSFGYINTTISATSDSNDYNVTFYCNDTVGNENSSNRIFFGVEKTAPVINLTDPDNEDSFTEDQRLYFYFNVTDEINIRECELITIDADDWEILDVRNNETTIQKNQINNISRYFSTPGGFAWRINCTDEADNTGTSLQRNLTITALGGGGGGGGGGGTTTTGSWISTFWATDSEFAAGYSKALGVRERVRVKVGTDYHYVGLTNFTSTSAVINVSSNISYQVTMAIGEERNFEVTGDNFYDIYVKINSISTTTNKTNVTIKSTSVPITGAAVGTNDTTPTTTTPTTTTSSQPTGTTTVPPEEGSNIWGTILFIVIMLVLAGGLAVGIYFGWQYYKQKKGVPGPPTPPTGAPGPPRPPLPPGVSAMPGVRAPMPSAPPALLPPPRMPPAQPPKPQTSSPPTSQPPQKTQ